MHMSVCDIDSITWVQGVGRPNRPTDQSDRQFGIGVRPAKHQEKPVLVLQINLGPLPASLAGAGQINIVVTGTARRLTR
jgi:hypothetical protein